MADNQTEKQKVQELTDKLERGLTELFNSESYKNYLSTMSKFHNYSFNNTLLIAMQKPEASLVAGYKAWQKNFDRHVNKGEKAIRILAPAPYKIKEERDKIDPVTQEIMLDRDGNPQKEEVEITIPAFRSVSDRESQIQMIADDIRTGNVKPLSIFLQASIDEGIDEDSERQAKELLVKLAEYKPLAKIEELEEQNYNMIDERLNNGVEKFNREEEKKEQQEKPEVRSSLKERLAAKQKEAAWGNNKDTKEQDKLKNRIGRCRNMKNLFTVEESNLICIFQSDSRTKVMEDINRVLKHIDDTNMIELCENVLEKLGKMSDKEFETLHLESAE